MAYIAYLHKERDSDFGVSFPDFPGCITAGKTLDEASRKAPEALAFHIAGMLEDGEKIPKPSKIDDLVSDPNRQNAVAFLVTADLSKSKTVRVNITARENQIDLIDRLASQAGLTRSAYMVQSATAGLASERRAPATRRRANARAARPIPPKTNHR
jgi:predicted RNase H-like HicB family nuclease